MRFSNSNSRNRLIAFLSRPIGRLLLLGLMVASMGAGVYGYRAVHKPGPVSAATLHGKPIKGYDSHASFEKECSHCHAPIHCITATRCQDCHMEIAKQREEGEGLHALLPGTDKCQNCHVEHQGRDAVISEFPFANVDHTALTGFSLDLHQTNLSGEAMTCDDCHTDHRFGPDSVDCVSCHTNTNAPFMEEHLGLFGKQCVECHDGQGRLADFDHDDFWVLDNAHATADCLDCHAGQVFSGRADDCGACHDQPDYHSDLFGAECDRCHTTEAWLPARLMRHDFDLNHGDSEEIACESCHTSSYTEYPCYSCHDRDETHEQHHLRDPEIEALENCLDCHPTGTRQEAIDLLFANSEFGAGE